MNSINEGPQGHKRRLVTPVLILIAFIIALGIGYIFVKETPRYSLYWFKKAILEHDAESALKYLDTDSIVDNIVKDISTEEDNDKAQPKDKSDGSMKNIGKDVIMQNLPAIKAQLREQLKSAIISYSNRAALDNLNKASVFGLHITMEGNTALVKIRGKDTVAFKMAKSSGGRWRIVAFNLKELKVLGGN
jgi:hypothetical protein